ncbi:CaiB/BaiF CoA transferase family protein [Yinghuangia seranimata]|uniref:CaiB/BaiF CoA transferase family protein n=1 Tax=Yinghuangia seranimata TaxID=408067 RepID=UPI00248C5D63|nr:CaiB/BaiF CoA-transferase family protein [Yinghuangia seranimata]MDI2130336.1 CaiB/BaiF CoA-transferase family protein [Yinghuangia seranimata]
MGTELLEGVTVLDLASVGPAARASRWLADYGADVVKVGPVPAKSGVQIAPPFFSYSAHRRMKRVLLDIKAPEGRDAFLALAAEADVVIESFRPGVVDRLGIGYAAVSAANPGIVYCSTSGFGQSGPKSQQAGHDLNYLASGGFLHLTGAGPDGGPPIPGATVADSAGGGMHAVIAILAALHHRAASGDGLGRHLDVSVADGVLALMALSVDEFLATGQDVEVGSNLLLGRYACYDTYQAGDGKWLAVAAIEPRFWANLCGLLGLDKWTRHQNDDAVQDDIRRDMAEVFRTKDRDTWVAELAPADTCVSGVLSVPELVEDEQFAARGAFVTAKHPAHGTFRQIGPVLAGMVPADEPYVCRESDATDTDELLARAGLAADRISALRDQGVVA